MSTNAVPPYLPQGVPSLPTKTAPEPFRLSATDVGTGGYTTVQYYLAPPSDNELPSPIVERMRMIRSAFGRNFSRIPAVFGVSRQTLYNWLQGEQPKIAHHARIESLAEAAEVFLACGYTPNYSDLGRTVRDGKSFIELISQGANGRCLAKDLMWLIYRGMESRKKLDSMLAKTSAPRLTPADFGAPAFDENSE